MRTLLVDNHDSFTYNLFDYLAQISGEEPTVVRNDDPGWRSGHLADFDRVVVSPGPGNAARPADFGICEDIVREAAVPLLGVCLGHQGIALAGGGKVSPAPEPCHGRISSVVHTGAGVFDGLPSPFDAARYHSLAVTRLPEEIEATAWTSDGILMGMQHRHRPLHGVQFHPESIGTEYGMQLLKNFVDLSPGRRTFFSGPLGATRPRESGNPREETPGPERNRPPRRRLRVRARRLRTRWDGEAVFQDLYGAAPRSFWLDSATATGELDRFSFMGDASGPLARVATADVSSRTVRVDSRTGTEIVTGDFLSWLDEDLRRTDTRVPGLPFDFTLGWVGCLGYGLTPVSGRAAAHPSREPDAAMLFADRAVVLDHREGMTYLLALEGEAPAAPGGDAPTDPGGEGAGERDTARAWLTRTARRLEALAGHGPAPAPAPPAHGVRVDLRHSRQEYLDLIRACQAELRSGESYEICLTNMASARVDLDPWRSYRYLRRFAPAPFAALLKFDELSVLSSSPERFLRVGADGTAESRPIKGTRPRGSTPEHDAALADELRTDEKELAENLMIVDLVRNDLGRCARTGSVAADDVFRVETYATVHQLVSTVTAVLDPRSSAVDCVRAAHPGGSMTGAPKERTMQIIDRLEGGPRGVYAGAIGYFSLSGAADLSIAIRTALLTPGLVRYGIGGAITALSDPEAEFEETAVKAAPLLALLGAVFPGRDTASENVSTGTRPA
ncbi:aminodeoxychorismate synthase component I [Streptomyces nitrosporeus]|uniref:Aminodeoxychorismate synthase n=1 Tax=Streptomyces nitrosporeus TaxID=28894 RepID=A0A5J6FH74_9ACTN|nr:aminodeoxychorismate synthase component I [Streptomyces nitrosporeus]QEU75553.1 aminodeoxychorismate synthase component I [Streptomyces nitrosporeus]GGZ29625.1 aminodeoxychorismate synthase, component I [Streptomyces nitrosporeus]